MVGSGIAGAMVHRPKPRPRIRSQSLGGVTKTQELRLRIVSRNVGLGAIYWERIWGLLPLRIVDVGSWFEKMGSGCTKMESIETLVPKKVACRNGLVMKGAVNLRGPKYVAGLCPIGGAEIIWLAQNGFAVIDYAGPVSLKYVLPIVASPR